MESDDIYKFIGYAAVVLFFIYLLSKVMKLNARIIEGLTPRNKATEEAAAAAAAAEAAAAQTPRPLNNNS